MSKVHVVSHFDGLNVIVRSTRNGLSLALGIWSHSQPTSSGRRAGSRIGPGACVWNVAGTGRTFRLHADSFLGRGDSANHQSTEPPADLISPHNEFINRFRYQNDILGGLGKEPCSTRLRPQVLFADIDVIILDSVCSTAPNRAA